MGRIVLFAVALIFLFLFFFTDRSRSHAIPADGRGVYSPAESEAGS